MKTESHSGLIARFSSLGRAAATKLAQISLLAFLGASIATPVFAQAAGGQGMGPGSGMGQGMGPGAGKGPGAGMGPGSGMGPGQGMGPGGGRAMRFNSNKDNTPGWKLMSAEERTAHRDRMRGAKTYDECKAVQDEHHKAMEARAKEKGVTLPAPRFNGCDRMKARGFFK